MSVRGLIGLVTGMLVPFTCVAAEKVIKDSQGMDCHVYLPEKVGAEKTYQLVVGVHGAGGKGKGAGGIAKWAERGDVIVIGPSFRTRGEGSYQNGNAEHAEKLIKLFEELGKEYRLEEKMFLFGFSGGSQFVHRFAMLHPKVVCGVSAHSGGSWATDGFGEISLRAKGIPFAISCGEKDTGKAWGEAKFNRITWFGRFRDEIDRKRFCYLARTWPGVGHGRAPGVMDLTRECFQLATGLPGKSAADEVEISGDWQNLGALRGR